MIHYIERARRKVKNAKARLQFIHGTKAASSAQAVREAALVGAVDSDGEAESDDEDLEEQDHMALKKARGKTGEEGSDGEDSSEDEDDSDGEGRAGIDRL